MSRSCKDKFSLRHELVRHAQAHGIRAAMRQFGCARNTVREWLRRWLAGDDTLADRSRRPHNQPARSKPACEKLVIEARRKAPCSGARRLIEMFELPVGKGAARRILRDASLVRKCPRTHKRKAAHAPLTRLPMDTQYLADIPPPLAPDASPEVPPELRTGGTSMCAHCLHQTRVIPARTPAQAARHHGIELQGVKLSEAKRGFVLLPKRWVVERSFGWLSRFRRLARDY